MKIHISNISSAFLKKLLLTVSLFILIFIIQGCKSDTEVSELIPVEPELTFVVSGYVLDVASPDYSPGMRANTPVRLDDITVTSDAGGEYKFTGIKQGKHIMSVDLAGYSPYRDTVNIQRDTTINIYLYGNKSDYFPRKSNSSLRFTYTSSSNNGVSGVGEEGVSTWQISEARTNANVTYFDVSETIIVTRTVYSPLYSQGKDTTYSSFTISENISGTISFAGGTLSGVSFERYQDQRLGDVISKSYNNPGSLISQIVISLKKNTGLIKIEQSGDGWGKNYTLIE